MLSGAGLAWLPRRAAPPVLYGPACPAWRELIDAAHGILRRGAHDGPCAQAPCYYHMAAYYERARRLRAALVSVDGLAP